MLFIFMANMHMKKLCIALLVVMCSLKCAAQNYEKRKSDSLIKLLPSLKDDTAKVKILNKISLTLVSIDPDKGYGYCSQALQLAKSINWTRGTALAYNCMGIIYNAKSDYAAAIEHDLKAIKIFEELGEKRNVAVCLRSVGLIYTDMHNYPKAIYYDSAALAIGKELNDKIMIMTCLNNMGVALKEIKDYKKALACDSAALNIAISLGDGELFSVGNGLGNIGTIYKELKDYPLALSYLFRALNIFKELGINTGIAECYGNIGEVYLSIAKDTKSNVKPDSLISANRATNMQHAKDYLTRAISISKELNDLAMTSTFLLDAVQADSLMGNYGEALANYYLFTKYKDSVFSNDMRLKVAGEETKREADLKEKQIEINKLAITQKKNERIIFIAGLGILILVALGIYSRYKNQKKANGLKDAALRQKEVLMKEIHHRVKNNLQVISTLLDMQLLNITDAPARTAMTESTTRLKAILLIHQQLYRDEDISTIECAHFATDLFRQITTVFKQPGQEITLHNHIPTTILDIDTAVPLGLILNELMTNSHKYAFNGGAGSIDISIQQTNHNYQLIYKDSGPGLPEEVDTKTLKSLGMKIMHGLAKQLGGTMLYDKEQKAFIINFKDLAGRKMIA